ncbi:hypothetical protein [Nonomuraea sp. NPDC005501]|uniref:hypothetical protein n=1 Tax=Nonomuraea sp. NPDC005501 TaxID=3156884 RepID=UPI0033A76118
MRRLLTSGLLPAAFAALLTASVLTFYGVSARDLAVFTAYLVLALVLPGTLLVRALHGGRHTQAEEITLGLTLGYAVEVPVYIAARALGQPLLVLVWPVATYAAFIAVPRLRRHWRATDRPRAPLWWSWSLAGFVAYLLAWSSLTFFRLHAMTWPQAGTSFIDMPFHLSLIGELRHHVPPAIPTVAGEPLSYHWFVFAHFAAASWVTGVEPLVLAYRLAVLPMLVAAVVLTGMLGQRIIGSRAGAWLSVAGLLFVAMPSLYANANGLLLWTGVQHIVWASPTQAFGALLVVFVLLLLTELLTEPRARTAGHWLLLGLLLAITMGAKASYLPPLVAALLLVAVVEAVRRRSPRPALAALGMAACCLVYAQYVLFGRATQGMAVDPLALARKTWQMLTGVTAEPAWPSVAAMTAVFLAGWAITWCGTFGLLSKPLSLLRPDTTLLAGMSGAGLAAGLLLGSTHLNEGYFIWSAYPCMAVLAAHGLLTVVRRERPSLWAMAGAAAAGMAAVHLVRLLTGTVVPLGPGRSDLPLYMPYIALAGVFALGAASLMVIRTRRRAWSLLLVMVMAAGAPAAWQVRVSLLRQGVGESVFHGAARPAPDLVPEGLLEAARWLRDHSGADDLIAVNTHCLWGHESPCDSRQFWASALTERRVLVEGWAYTATNLAREIPGVPVLSHPFWDEELLRTNDAVFRHPSATAVRLLRERYGVRWLLVDERAPGTASRLGDFAQFRYRAGDYAVYQTAVQTARQ